MTSILIIEDDAAILNSYAFLFAKKGYEVHSATNASDGLRLALEVQPQVIILDMLMPGTSGLELLRQLNPKNSLPQTKILVMSNTESSNIMSEALELGASLYLLKVEHTPYTLVDTVDGLLNPSTA